jgi:hypothetical protein
MARCGCSGECLCVVEGGCGVTVGGNGTLSTPYTVTADISALPGNGLTCETDGLFAGAAVQTADTDCIALDGVGSVGDPLTASPVFSGDAGNVLECRDDGLYAPAAGTAGATNFALFEDGGSNPTILPADGGGHSSISMDFDTLLGSAGINAYTVGTGADHAWAYVEITAAGYYHVAIGLNGWGVGPAYDSDATMSAVIKIQPGGPPAAEIRWLWATVPLNNTSDYDQPGNNPFISTSGIRYFDVGDQLWPKFAFDDWTNSAFAGATLNTTDPAPSWFHIWRIGV